MAHFEKLLFCSGGNLYKKEKIALLAQLFNINIFKTLSACTSIFETVAKLANLW